MRNRTWFYKLLMLTVLLLVSGVWPQTAEALTCAPPKSAMEEFERSESVFRAVAVKREWMDSGPIVTFRTVTWWKGTAAKRVKLLENEMWRKYEIGEQYLIYAKPGQSSLLVANLCGRSNRWKLAGGDAESFGPSIADYTSSLNVERPAWFYAAIVIGITGIAFWVGFASYRRRRR